MSVANTFSHEASKSDFTEILRKQSLKENNRRINNRQNRGEELVNTAVDSFNSSTNRNLSSVLLEIKDDGPAYASSSQAGELQDYISQQQISDTVDNNPEQEINNDAFSQEDIVSLSSAAKKPKRGLKLRATHAKNNFNIGKGLLFIGLTSVVVGGLYLFDLRAKDIEKSLVGYEEKLQQSITLQSESVPEDLTRINAQLQTLQNDLKQLTQNNSADTRKEEEMKSLQLAEEIEKSALLEKSITVLNEEIQTLKNNLKTANEKLEVANKKSLESKKLNEQTISKNSYSITLASLSNKTKAESIVKQLTDEGLKPAMKKIDLSGKPIYRLSVTGFSDRGAAESFIVKASKKYGVKNLQIRTIKNG